MSSKPRYKFVNCGKCAFSDMGEGLCRRNPFVKTVSEQDWCGEFVKSDKAGAWFATRVNMEQATHAGGSDFAI